MNSLSEQLRQADNLATECGSRHSPGSASMPTKRRWRERGQSMVEMAFILPIFLGFVFGIIEYGRAWSTRQSLTLAAREGARVLILPYGAGLTFASEGAKQQAALDIVKSYLSNSGVVATNNTQIIPIRLLPGGDNVIGTIDDTIEQNYSGGKRGDRVGIRIIHTFETPLPFILTMFGNGDKESDAGTPNSEIRMGMTCYLEHE